jgi:small-conductance mechanosensitive channel
MSEPTFLERLGANFSAMISGMLENFFGAVLATPLSGAATWGDILAALILLAAVLVVTGTAKGWLRWLEKANERREALESWRHQFVVAFSKPIYALIWLYGSYVAVVPLLVRAQTTSEAVSGTRFAAEKLLDLGVFVIVVWLFYRLTRVLEVRLGVWVKKSASKMDDVLAAPLIKTLRVLLPLVAVILGLPLLGLPADYDDFVSKVTSLVLIGSVAWVLVQGVRLVETVLLTRHDLQAADNLEARKMHTQVRVLSKSVYFIITIFTVASMLMVFEEVQRFGTNILASAGVVGIILGFAAQRTIANLFAGFQLAMAQPIRIDDVVIVEGEWGRIEEVTLTYVVIKIWDQRRLIVPLSHFIEKPFQNWTRTSSEILGSVFFYADYSVPIEEIRAETKRLVESNPNWDKKFWNVQVTEATDRAVQVRVLVTASDSGKAWNMRCEIREALIAFLQKNHPGSLPRVRAEIENREPGRSHSPNVADATGGGPATPPR